MKIKIFDYLSTYHDIEEEIHNAVRDVLTSGRLILGPQTASFEEEFAELIGVKHCIGVASGTTALHLALWAKGIKDGDEVITVANTCVPTVAAIRLCHATPVFVDVSADDLLMDISQIEAAITSKTKAIICVHLWGQPVDLTGLLSIVRRHNLTLIEDCAQSQGAYYHHQHTGTFGKMGCFSFYPTKNLGAYGDGGAVVTNDDSLAERARNMRMYGYTKPNYSEYEGMNARISEIQSAILRVKMKHLSDWLKKRKENAKILLEKINNPRITLPKTYPDREASYHQFVIRTNSRESLIRKLEANDIEYGIHYPTPIHQMPPYRKYSGPLPVTESSASKILSIPVHEALNEKMLEKTIEVLNKD